MPTEPAPPVAPQADPSGSIRISESVNRHGIRRPFRKDSLHTRTVEELDADPDLAGGVKWLVEDMIPSAALTVLYGIGKGGKTTLLSHVAAAVVSGTTILERDTLAGPVLWVDLEQQIALTRDCLKGAGAIDCTHKVHVYNGPAPILAAIEQATTQNGAVLVVIDSLSKLLGLRDENDAAEVTRGITPLLELCRSTGAAVVAIHHDRKREGVGGRNMRGSSAFLAAVDVAISLKVDGSDKEGRRTLDFVSRYSPPNGTSLSIRLTDSGYEVQGDRQAVRLEELVRALGEYERTAEDIAARLNLTRPGILPVLTKAVSGGRLARMGTGRKGDPYRFRVVGKAEAVVVPEVSSGLQHV